MNPAKYPSKGRVERDGVLVHAEGDDLINDPDEAKRQGYNLDTEDGAATARVTKRIEKDGVLIAAEGDEIPADQAKDLGIKSSAVETPEPGPTPAKAQASKRTRS